MSKGRFGVHGGQYMPETLMNAVIELEEAYNHYKNDPEFNAELTELLNNYAGRPSRLYFAGMRPVTSAVRRSISSARISTTPAPIKSTTCSVRRCWRKKWARPV